VLSCPAFGTLAVRSWVLLPVLFLGSSAGVAALLKLTLLRHPAYDPDVTLSAPLLFGFAATLALLSASSVQWSSPRQRRWLRMGYPVLMLGGALGLDSFQLPLIAALGIGTVAVTLLAVLVFHSYDRPLECSEL
jgi:hypothetical protein